MHKVFLSTTLPEDAIIRGKSTAPDIQMKLHEFRDEQATYRNEAPKIRPHLLEKYDVAKEKESISPNELTEHVDGEESPAPLMEIDDDGYERAVLTLPAANRNRARRLQPHIKKIYLHGQRLADVLYDLSVPARKVKVQNDEALRAIVRQLDHLHDLPGTMYLRKGFDTPAKAPTPGHSAPRRVVDGTPTRRATRSAAKEREAFFTPERKELHWI